MDRPHATPHLLCRHSLPLAIAILSIALNLGGEQITLALRYEYQAIGDGQLWRLISGHFVHLGTSHLIMNLLGLGLIWGLFFHLLPNAGWLLITLCSALFISLGFYLLQPQLSWYVGLSGILHSLFVAGTLAAIRSGDHREAILLVAIVGKLIWEQMVGPLPGTTELANGPVIVDAHLYGALSGALLVWCIKPRTQSMS